MSDPSKSGPAGGPGTRQAAPGISHDARRRALARVSFLEKALDGVVNVPGTGIGLGLDAVIGLVPGVGDVLGLALSGVIVWDAVRLGVPAVGILRMLGNVAADAVIGLVPVLGDVSDVAFRANRRNVAVLRSYVGADGLGAPRSSRSSRRFLALLVVGTVILLGTIVVSVGRLLFRALFG